MIKTYEKAKYAVIFYSCKNVPLEKDYYEMTEILGKRVEKINGYVARENVIDENGHSITVSYWRNLEALKKWFQDEKHQEAQINARKKWYAGFKAVVCKIEKQKVWSV